MASESLRLDDLRPHLEGGPEPVVDRGAVGRHLGQHSHGVEDTGHVGGGHVAAQVGRFHRAGASAGGHGVVDAEPVAEPGGVGIPGIVTGQPRGHP